MRWLTSALLAATLAVMVVCTVIAATDEASISSVSDDGAYLTLDDGTGWLVSAPYRPSVSTWQVSDNVVYTDDTKACPSYKLINTDENADTACASPVK